LAFVEVLESGRTHGTVVSVILIAEANTQISMEERKMQRGRRERSFYISSGAEIGIFKVREPESGV
jgi:hypothetical protein